VIVSVVFGVRAFKQRGEKKATAKLAQVIAIADRRVRDAGEAVDPKKPADDSFADEKAKATAVLAAIAANDVKAPPQFEGPFLVTVGRYDDAITGYHTCQTLAEGLDGVICREGLGLALEAKAAATTDLAAQKAGYQAALEAFKVLQPDADGPRAAIAKYHEGRMQELLGNATEAKAAFEKAKTMDKDGGELGALIEARLATLGA
jgi:tetratricopeptide (TPR) repeat protein